MNIFSSDYSNKTVGSNKTVKMIRKFKNQSYVSIYLKNKLVINCNETYIKFCSCNENKCRKQKKNIFYHLEDVRIKIKDKTYNLEFIDAYKKKIINGITLIKKNVTNYRVETIKELALKYHTSLKNILDFAGEEVLSEYNSEDSEDSDNYLTINNKKISLVIDLEKLKLEKLKNDHKEISYIFLDKELASSILISNENFNKNTQTINTQTINTQTDKSCNKKNKKILKKILDNIYLKNFLNNKGKSQDCAIF